MTSDECNLKTFPESRRTPYDIIYQEWKETFEKELQNLKPSPSVTHVVGDTLGKTLALRIAYKKGFNDCKKLVLGVTDSKFSTARLREEGVTE